MRNSCDGRDVLRGCVYIYTQHRNITLTRERNIGTNYATRAQQNKETRKHMDIKSLKKSSLEDLRLETRKPDLVRQKTQHFQKPVENLRNISAVFGGQCCAENQGNFDTLRRYLEVELERHEIDPTAAKKIATAVIHNVTCTIDDCRRVQA